MAGNLNGFFLQKKKPPRLSKDEIDSMVKAAGLDEVSQIINYQDFFQNFLCDSMKWTNGILTKWCSNPISSDKFPGFSKGVLTHQGFGMGAVTYDFA